MIGTNFGTWTAKYGALEHLFAGIFSLFPGRPRWNLLIDLNVLNVHVLIVLNVSFFTKLLSHFLPFCFPAPHLCVEIRVFRSKSGSCHWRVFTTAKYRIDSEIFLIFFIVRVLRKYRLIDLSIAVSFYPFFCLCVKLILLHPLGFLYMKYHF